MSRQFLSYLTMGLVVSAFVACGSDDDDDNMSTQTSGTTTRSTGSFPTGSGGSTGATTRGPTGTTGATNNTQGTTQGSGGATGIGGSGGMSGAAGLGGAAGEGGMAGAAALVDEELLHAARTANIGEVDQAEVALLRADDPLVVDFAEMMVAEHSSAIAMAQSLADSEDLTPKSNPISRMLQAESEQVILTLEAASDEEFDLVYMESQVTAHEEVLALLEDTLIPQADNAALETYLSTLRVHVAEHLESAETIIEALE